MPCTHLNRRQFLLATAAATAMLGESRAETIAFPKAIEDRETRYLTWQDLARAGWLFEHWTPEDNGAWEWYRLERYVSGSWKTIGLTSPMDTESGEPLESDEGYLDRRQVPHHVLVGEFPSIPLEVVTLLAPSQYGSGERESRAPDPAIRARHGKPPSDWLKSLWAAELREWLSGLRVPVATVRDMTYWVHLVRDHGFDPLRIDGLTEAEFLQLHSAAHHGY